MPNVPPPPTSMTAWQWLIFVAIVAAFTLIQTWFIHKKIDATTVQSDATKAQNDRFELVKTLITNALPLLYSSLMKTPAPPAPTTAVYPDPHVAPLPPNQPAPPPPPSLSSPTAVPEVK